MSGGHLCEAEAPTEATAETSAPPVTNLIFYQRKTASKLSAFPYRGKGDRNAVDEGSPIK